MMTSASNYFDLKDSSFNKPDFTLLQGTEHIRINKLNKKRKDRSMRSKKLFILFFLLTLFVLSQFNSAHADGSTPLLISVDRVLGGVPGHATVWWHETGWDKRTVYFDNGTAPSILLFASGGTADWYYDLENNHGYSEDWTGASSSHEFFPYPPEGNYRAWVDGIWIGGLGEEFYLRECGVPGEVSLISPNDEYTTDDRTPDFRWEEADDANEYLIYICYTRGMYISRRWSKSRIN